MKVGDLVRTPRYGTYYLIVGKREDLSSSTGGRVFDIVRADEPRSRQVLNEYLLEVISESR